jgi:hypothetical protein
MPSIIDAAERDKEIAELQSRIYAQMRGGLVAVIKRAQERSELPRSENPRETAAFILGPIGIGGSFRGSRWTRPLRKPLSSVPFASTNSQNSNDIAFGKSSVIAAAKNFKSVPRKVPLRFTQTDEDAYVGCCLRQR